jgi:hypothetical protein
MSTAEAVMTTQDVANRMSELFKEYKWSQVQEELFAEDAVSIEPDHSPGLKTAKGIDAIKKKGDEFNEAVEEMHGGWISDLVVGGRYISCAMGLDVTMKGAGRVNMQEICLYEVKDGKIVMEQFFY